MVQLFCSMMDFIYRYVDAEMGIFRPLSVLCSLILIEKNNVVD